MKKLLTVVLCLIWAPVAADPQTAVAAVRSIPGISNAMEDNAGNLWVMVQNNPQGQYNLVAANICKIVRPHAARIFLVKVVDVATVVPKSKPKDWGFLGGANCGMVQ